MSSFSRPSRRFLVFAFFLLIGLLYVLFGVALILAGDPRFSPSSTFLWGGAAGIYGAVLLLIWGYAGLREYVSLRNLWLSLLVIAFLFSAGGVCLLRSDSDIGNARPGLALLGGIGLTLAVGAVATWGTLHRRSPYSVDDAIPASRGAGFAKRYGRRSRY